MLHFVCYLFLFLLFVILNGLAQCTENSLFFSDTNACLVYFSFVSFHYSFFTLGYNFINSPQNLSSFARMPLKILLFWYHRCFVRLNPSPHILYRTHTHARILIFVTFLARVCSLALSLSFTLWHSIVQYILYAYSAPDNNGTFCFLCVINMPFYGSNIDPFKCFVFLISSLSLLQSSPLLLF